MRRLDPVLISVEYFRSAFALPLGRFFPQHWLPAGERGAPTSRGGGRGDRGNAR